MSPESLARRLQAAPSRALPSGSASRRAAVVLLLRDGADDPEALFIRRAERDDDPWSGHTALPGGRREADDRDLRHTARRELREETGLTLASEQILGRLDDLHPRSRRLPSVAITPFVAWQEGGGLVRPGPEVAGHLWIPLPELVSPRRRSVVSFRRQGAIRAFPAIEYRDHVIWGITYAIVDRFLELAVPDEEEDPDG